MIVNCRSCKQKKEMPISLALWWTFHRRIFWCLDCTPADVHARMVEQDAQFWKNRL